MRLLSRQSAKTRSGGNTIRCETGFPGTDPAWMKRKTAPEEGLNASAAAFGRNGGRYALQSFG